MHFSEFMLEHFRVREISADCEPGQAEVIEPPIPGHLHNFFHLTVVMRGRVRIKCHRQAFRDDGTPMLGNDGEEVWHLLRDQEFEAGDMVSILPRDRHEIIPMTPYFKIRCLFLSRDPVTHIPVDLDNGWSAASAAAAI